MIRFFHKYLRPFAFFMTAVIINLSIDAPDYGHYVDDQFVSAEDLSINEVESISEWIMEHVFDVHDAFPEADEDDETSLAKMVIDYLFVNSNPASNVFSLIFDFSFKAVHVYFPSLWDCDAILILIQPPRL